MKDFSGKRASDLRLTGPGICAMPLHAPTRRYGCPLEAHPPLQIPCFIDKGARVVIDLEFDSLTAKFAGYEPELTLENNGPQRQLFFNPADTTAAIVTCGGLCPGQRYPCDRKRAAQYGIRHIRIIPYGYEGLNPAKGRVIAPLMFERGIDRVGGAITGSSRGNQDPVIMVDMLISHGVNILFAVDGERHRSC